MERINCFDLIYSRITSMKQGEVFIISDFFDLEEEASICKVLSRLEEEGKIRRIMRGVYDCPQRNVSEIAALTTTYANLFADVTAHISLLTLELQRF